MSEILEWIAHPFISFFDTVGWWSLGAIAIAFIMGITLAAYR